MSRDSPFDVSRSLVALALLTGLGRPALAQSISSADPDSGLLGSYLDDWNDRVEAARSTQPSWSSPLVTTTAMVEQRLRFDTSFQHAGNGAATTDLDGGKGVDLIITETTELQIAAAPYLIRTTPSGKGEISGFNDWPVFRIKERLLSSPEDAGDYVLSAWVQTQAATGVNALTSNAFEILPTVGFGRGFDAFVIQGTFGAVLPLEHEGILGNQLAGNLALQYHIARLFWPQIEANWTHWLGGERDAKDQVLLTPGIVLGRLSLTDRLKFTCGVGYQFAVAPKYQPKPLLPAEDNAWIVTTRLTF